MHPSRSTLWTSLMLLVVAALLAPALAAKKPPAKKGDPANATPNEAQWTLFCQAIAGPTHVEQAKAIKDQLLAATGKKDWHVIHQEDGQSVLYYGYYRTISDDVARAADAADARDKKEGERAQRDLREIARLADAAGNRLFEHVFFVQLPAPDPAAPAEWNLINAGGVYTLQIAAYKDDPRRKQAAVDAVRDARAQGIEAYFYHGETTSSVCIGAWPRSAVAGNDEEDKAKGIVPDSRDPNETMLILPHQTADQDALKVHDREGGERIRTYAPTLRPIDPSLIAMMEKYPTHAVNGIVYRTKVPGESREVEDPSYVVEIPKPKASLLRQQQQQPPPELLAAPTPAHAAPAGGGRLKSLGD